jgi:glycosyltransferase involved in cell wall biosynthesis
VSFGVNVVGFVSARLGIGVAARASVAALVAAKVPVSVLDLQLPDGRSGFDTSWAHLSLTNPGAIAHPINLVHVNPPEAKDVWLQAPQIFAGRRNYAVPFFELADMPDNWYAHLARYDALLAASEHIAAAARNRLALPVRHYPMAATVEMVKPFDRSALNIPADAFAFAATFDTDSGLNRKNGIGMLRAFANAFGDRSDVVLVLKVNGTAKHVELDVEIARMRPGSVRVVDAYLPYAEVLGLYAACDAFVSLHRAEGLGLGLMEAMLLGKPVIATGWSGSMDFMDDASAALVRFSFTPVLDTQAAYAPREFSRMQLWAEPDLLHASQLMRRLAGDRTYANALGAAGKAYAQSRYENFFGGGAARVIRSLFEA